MPKPDVEAYSYAACYTCTWKLSRHGDAHVSQEVHAAAQEHAEKEGHRVGVCENFHTSFDYRVERPA